MSGPVIINRTDAPTQNGSARFRDNGKSLESLIMASQYGVALTKPETSSRRLNGTLIQMPSPVDFFGIHIASRRLIVLDAKQCANANHLTTSESTLKEHQRRFVVQYGGYGAIAGLIAECSPVGKIYFVPWWMLRERRPSIAWGECVHIGESNRVLMAADWDRVAQASNPQGDL